MNQVHFTFLGKVISMPPKDMRLIVLGCMQCMYAASDLAGTMKLQYDVSSRIIRMPCTARLDINFILKALQEGADGVLVVGCHPGDCAYKTGNLGAERRVRFARKLVGQMGMNEDRVKMVFVSAAEGDKFAAEINKFADEIRAIGPNPIRL
ncbi:MAG: hydrogenase iron-sulfur subunit [Candidatus Thorarchaeota archaeon]|jgi:F420-non-reducing hydrogenase iron-sulfur subunit